MDNSISKQIKQRGISEALFKKQLNDLTTGFESSNLVRACVPEDGILSFTDSELKSWGEHFDDLSSKRKIVKFVPASGAASRMFKHLHHYSENKDSDLVKTFIARFDEFPFVEDLNNYFHSKNIDLSSLIKEGNWQEIIDGILVGLGYGSCPKGMVKFHQYNDKSKNAFEEHLGEAIAYSSGKNQEIHIHFTVPEHYQLKIESFIKSVLELEFKKEQQRMSISYSKQLKSTDTIAVDMENNLIKNSKGELLFRPGGHGALIHNLNTIDADVIFVKNIDNVVHASNLADTIIYKKGLAGYALSIQKALFDILRSNENDQDVRSQVDKISPLFDLEGSDLLTQEQIKKAFNRPLRICGMVKNEGEPGGGPFWGKDKQGEISCQIVEKDQIDISNEKQLAILNNSTHFNPVDLICLTKDYKNTSFNLHDFIDHNAGFISEKSISGKELKALELPGLWNGAMAKWLTLFVEVSSSTFNPVKTVNDLLRPAHTKKLNA